VGYLFVLFLRVHDAEGALSVADECAASIAIGGGEVGDVGAGWGGSYMGFSCLNRASLLKEYFCLAGEVLRE
jgi:hypothetical protein